MTSRELPKTRLSSFEGSYSQIAVAFSTTAIFVICFMTSTFPRLTTCPKQLKIIKKTGKKDSKLKIANKHTVIVVRIYTILEDHNMHLYSRLFNKLCRCCWCYLMSPCRAKVGN